MERENMSIYAARRLPTLYCSFSMVYGGPRAYATTLLRKHNSDLEKDFTVAYWDQRNVEKSYQRDFPVDYIKVALYNQDVDFWVSYLGKRFEEDKIFLMGHSWGSRLGIYGIHRNPTHFMVYADIGQELEAYRGRTAFLPLYLGKS